MEAEANSPRNRQLAAELITEARSRQGVNSKQFSGPNHLNQEELDRVSSTVKTVLFLQSLPPLSYSASLSLIERFEELCRRLMVEISPSLREPIYEQLARELTTNHKVLGGQIKHLVAGTLLHGDLTVLMTDPKYASWHDTPSLIRNAIRRRPRDPHGFLQEAEQLITVLNSDPEFAIWCEMPGLIRRTVILRPKDPKGFLRNATKIAKALECDPRLKIWNDSPWVYRRTAFDYPTDPLGSLLQLTELVRELEHDPELAVWRKTPWVFKKAVLSHPKNTKQFLKRAATTANALENEMKLADVKFISSVFKHSALTNPNNPHSFLHNAALVNQPKPSQTPSNHHTSTTSDLVNEYLKEFRTSIHRRKGSSGIERWSRRSSDHVIFSAIASSKYCKQLDPEVAQIMTTKLEKLAHCRKIPIPPEIRAEIYDRLAQDLQANVAAYGGNAQKLIGVTLHQGNVSNMVSNTELSRFKNTPGMYAYAARNYPINPIGFLRKLGTESDRLRSDPRFVYFKNNPNIFMTAVISHPKNPVKYLIETEATIKRLWNDPRFSKLHKTPYIFPQIAIRNRKDPDAALEKFAASKGYA